VPGTTRDVLRERINLGGLPLVIIDTAGLRTSADPVEREGVRRARAEIAAADHVLLVTDPVATEAGAVSEDPLTLANQENLTLSQVTVIENKADLTGLPTGLITPVGAPARLRLSALTGLGCDALESHLKHLAGYRADEGGFSARRRHLDALARAAAEVDRARTALVDAAAGELVAEDLRNAHRALGEIVGETTSDALLGAIFASFCIGK
jgi:tRNA modification GTPase